MSGLEIAAVRRLIAASRAYALAEARRGVSVKHLDEDAPIRKEYDAAVLGVEALFL